MTSMSRSISCGAFPSFSTNRSTGRLSILAKSATIPRSFFTLKPAAGRFSAFFPASCPRAGNRILTELVVIVEVLETANLARHALANHRALLMDNSIRIAKTGLDARGPGPPWGLDRRSWSEYSPLSWEV